MFWSRNQFPQYRPFHDHHASLIGVDYVSSSSSMLGTGSSTLQRSTAVAATVVAAGAAWFFYHKFQQMKEIEENQKKLEKAKVDAKKTASSMKEGTREIYVSTIMGQNNSSASTSSSNPLPSQQDASFTATAESLVSIMPSTSRSVVGLDSDETAVATLVSTPTSSQSTSPSLGVTDPLDPSPNTEIESSDVLQDNSDDLEHVASVTPQAEPLSSAREVGSTEPFLEESIQEASILDDKKPSAAEVTIVFAEPISSSQPSHDLVGEGDATVEVGKSAEIPTRESAKEQKTAEQHPMETPKDPHSSKASSPSEPSSDAVDEPAVEDNSDTSKIVFSAQQKAALEEFKEKVETIQVPVDEEIHLFFDEIDVNGDGSLSLKEIEKAMIKRKFNLQPTVVMRAFEKADLDNDGSIGRDEFFFFMRSITYFKNLLNIFKFIDKDGNRRLSKQEFITAAAILHVPNPHEVFEEMDENRGGYIVFDEFCLYMAEHKYNQGAFR